MTRARLRAGRAISYQPTAAEVALLSFGKEGDRWPGQILSVRPNGSANIEVGRPDGKRFTTTAVLGNGPGQFTYDLVTRSLHPEISSSVDVREAEGRVDLYVAPSNEMASDANDGLDPDDSPLASLDEAIRRFNKLRLLLEDSPFVIHLESGVHTLDENLLPSILRSPLVIIGDGAEQSGDDAWTELDSGTLQAGSTTSNIVTSGGLTAKALLGKQIVITSGANAGFRRSINTNTTTDVTPAQRFVSVAVGDGYRIVEPAAVIEIKTFSPAGDPTANSPNNGFRISGMGVGDVVRASDFANLSGAADQMFPAFINVRFSPDAAASVRFDVQRSTVGFWGCEFDRGASLVFAMSADRDSTLLFGSDYFGGYVRSVLPVTLGLVSDTRAWGCYGVFFDGLILTSGIEGKIHGTLHANDEIRLVGCELGLWGGSIINSESFCMILQEMVRGKIQGALGVNFLMENDNANKLEEEAVCLSVTGGVVISLDDIDFVKDDGRAGLFAYSTHSGQGGTAPQVSLTSSCSFTGSNGVEHAIIVSGRAIVGWRASPSATGFAVGTEVAVIRRNMSGTLIEQQDFGDFVVGDVLPASGVSDGRDGWAVAL